MFYVYPMFMKVNRKNRAEVLRVSIFEYDEEEHMRQERKALKRAKNVVKCE